MRNALGAVDSVLLLGGRSEIGLEIVDLLVRLGASRVVLAMREPLDPPPSSTPRCTCCRSRR